MEEPEIYVEWELRLLDELWNRSQVQLGDATAPPINQDPAKRLVYRIRGPCLSEDPGNSDSTGLDLDLDSPGQGRKDQPMFTSPRPHLHTSPHCRPLTSIPSSQRMLQKRYTPTKDRLGRQIKGDPPVQLGPKQHSTNYILPLHIQQSALAPSKPRARPLRPLPRPDQDSPSPPIRGQTVPSPDSPPAIRACGLPIAPQSHW